MTSEMTTATLNPRELPILDRGDAPQIIVTGVRGAMNHDAVTTLSLTNLIYGAPDSDIEGPMEMVVCRLVIPAGSIQRIIDVLEKQKEAQIARGTLVIDPDFEGGTDNDI